MKTPKTIDQNDLRRARLRGIRDGAPLAGAGRARTFSDRKKARDKSACRGAW